MEQTMKWKQQGPTSLTALAPRAYGGKFIIRQDGGDFVVEHLSTQCRYFDDPSGGLKRLKRNIGRAPSLPEAQAVAAAFIRDEYRWPEVPVEIVAA
jgi:hypothetical protein